MRPTAESRKESLCKPSCKCRISSAGILINQYEILAALRPQELAVFNRYAEIVQEGYYEMWADEAIGSLSNPLPYEELDYVGRVMEMFDWIQISYDRLSAAEKATIEEIDVRFPGFDGNHETSYMAYARFLTEKMNRFASLRLMDGMNSHFPTRDRYEAMLSVLPRRHWADKPYLSAAEIRTLAKLA